MYRLFEGIETSEHSVCYKGGETMRPYDPTDIAGMKESDGSIKCAECMDPQDWQDLEDNSTITPEEIQQSQEFYYCDYCEKTM